MDLTLVVMAAGMGSRFGGLKQIEPVDDDGNFLIDYSVYDAIKAGFKKVVFVIKEELYDDFKKTIGVRLEGKIKVSYAFQKIDDIPYENKEIVGLRTKPWGTVQAILAASKEIIGNFAVINADDFYGFNAYEQLVKFFKENKAPSHYVAVTYPYYVTQSLAGSVKRGVCQINNNQLQKIIECSIENKNGHIIASPLNGDEAFTIAKDTLVSMNIFGFTADFLDILKKYFEDFFKNDKNYILNNEALLPECLEKYLANKQITITCYKATSPWLGMTYKSDLEIVKKRLNELKENGDYPFHLWE